MENAAKMGVRPEQINDRITPEPIKPPPNIAPAEPSYGTTQISPVENVPLINVSLHTVPLATDPKDSTDPIDMKAETDQQLDNLCKKLSDFSTLKCMAIDICGIKEPDYSSLLQLAASASIPDKEGKLPSLWKLFKNRYKPSLYGKNLRRAFSISGSLESLP